jgi:preprotein translocase subunit YajC
MRYLPWLDKAKEEAFMNRILVGLLTFVSLVLTSPVFAEEETAPTRDGGAWQGLVMVAIAFAFFYFILWRPEQRRRKEVERKRAALQKGDRVTAMGIIGTVVRVWDHTVILKMHDGSKIEFLKAAINEVSPPASEDEGKKEDKTDAEDSKKD